MNIYFKLICKNIIIGLFLFCDAAKANDYGLDPLQLSVDQMDRGECVAAWNTLWPLVKKKDADALSLLVALVLSRGLVPPTGLRDGAHDSALRLKQGYALAMYGWRTTRKDFYDLKLLTDAIHKQFKKDVYVRIIECLSKYEDKDICVSIAVSNNIIDNYENFIYSINNYNAPASCSINK